MYLVFFYAYTHYTLGKCPKILSTCFTGTMAGFTGFTNLELAARTYQCLIARKCKVSRLQVAPMTATTVAGGWQLGGQS